MAAGREVIIVGDINIMRAPIDSGEGGIRTSATQHYEHPARVIFNDWCAPFGPMIDVVRESFPDRDDMFTCWNTKLDARPSNYGSRIDYILCSPGLRPWIKGGDILAKVYGSDHCPVYLDLHDSIETPTGTLQLRDMLNPSNRTPSTAPLYPCDPPRTAPEPPRFATKFLEEFSGPANNVGKASSVAVPRDEEIQMILGYHIPPVQASLRISLLRRRKKCHSHQVSLLPESPRKTFCPHPPRPSAWHEQLLRRWIHRQAAAITHPPREPADPKRST